MCDAVWCTPYIWAPVWFLTQVRTQERLCGFLPKRYIKCSTFTFTFYLWSHWTRFLIFVRIYLTISLSTWKWLTTRQLDHTHQLQPYSWLHCNSPASLTSKWLICTKYDKQKMAKDVGNRVLPKRMLPPGMILNFWHWPLNLKFNQILKSA